MTTPDVYKAPESDLSVEKDTTSEPVYAGFWVRAVASIIDTILIMLFTVPLVFTVYGSGFLLSDSMINGSWDFVISYVLPAIAVVLFWHFKSATPGKMVMGLKVISLGESEHMSIGKSALRYIGYYPSMMIFMLGIIWVAFDKKKQGWHDKIANTAVIKSR